MLAYQDIWVREPRLLIPGHKPIGPVRIDWSNPITKGLDVCLMMTPPNIRNLAKGPVTHQGPFRFSAKGGQFVYDSDGSQAYLVDRTNTTFSVAVGTYKNGSGNYSARANPATNATYLGHYNAPSDGISGAGSLDAFTSTFSVGDVVHSIFCFESAVRYAKQWYWRGRSQVLEGATATTEGAMTWRIPYGAYNDPVYFFYWDRFLGLGERTELLKNPYQFVIPV